jgi:putative heme-binding domain-containing protein
MGAVLSAGFRLTLPDPIAPLPASLKLAQSPHEALAEGDAPRFGLFTVAEWHQSLKPEAGRASLTRALVERAQRDDDSAIRLQALRFVVLLRDPDMADSLWSLFQASTDPAPTELAANGLLGIELPPGRQDEILTLILSHSSVSPELKAQAVGRMKSIEPLRKLALAHALSPELRARAIERLHELQDAGLAAVLAMVRPDSDVRVLQAVDTAQGRAPRSASGKTATKELEAHFRNANWDELWKTGDAVRDKTLYARRNAIGQSCQSCHSRDGQGGRLGPNLDAAGQRLKPAYMAESILHPDRSIVPEFKTFKLSFTGGQSATGVVLGEDGQTVTIGLSNGTSATYNRAIISWQTALDTSIMPAGQISTPQELLDLIAYLMAPPASQPSP